jgi:hypothetical protein
VPALLDPIRHEVIRTNGPCAQPEVPAFHTSFMNTVRTYGRIHELHLIRQYKMKTKTFFADMGLGWKMFRKGKIHLLPHRSKNVGKVKELFQQSSMK